MADAYEAVVTWHEDEGPAWRSPWERPRRGIPDDPAPAVTYDGETLALAHRVGFDADHRPVLAETWVVDTWHLVSVWQHGDGYADRYAGDEITRLIFWRDGVIVAAVTAEKRNAGAERWRLDDGGVPVEGAVAWLTRRQYEAHRYDVVLAEGGELVRIDVGYERARRDDDDEVALLAALSRARDLETEWSEAPARREEVHAPLFERESQMAAPAHPVLETVPRDRNGIRDALVEVGLDDDDAERIVRDAVVDAVRLVPDDTAGSRVGGPALLPPDEDWPRDGEGRPLTFLAGIDLSEIALAGPLPERGWLLFFADLATDDGSGLIEESPVGADDPARLAFTDNPVGATPPDDLEVLLRERRVRPVPTVALPDDYEAPERLGLADDKAMAYGAVTDTLRATGLLGPWSGSQFEPQEPGSVLLLHLEPDDDFDFLDAGTIQFRIHADALADGRWDEAFAVPESA